MQILATVSNCDDSIFLQQDALHNGDATEEFDEKHDVGDVGDDGCENHKSCACRLLQILGTRLHIA